MMQRVQWNETAAAHRRVAKPRTMAGLMIVVSTFAGGCRAMTGPGDLSALEGNGAASPVVQTSAESEVEPSMLEKTKKTSVQVANFLSGRELEDNERARELYQQGDALFREAEKQTLKEAQPTFRKAAKFFGRAAEAAPGTALEQDALFMQGESLFFADRLTEASDVYGKLQKRFPRNRHIDLVASRLFSISRYWIDTVKADQQSWVPINLTDPTRPRLDTDGHAIRVLDQIRYDDPTGRLADDATMAAAAEYIRQKKFEEADEFLTDLRQTFTDSEHLFLAHMLGIRCKLENYAGPAYSGLVLEEAEELVRKTRQRFPDRLADPTYGDMVARAAAEIAYHQAARYAYRAEYREKKKEYGAARYYYRQLLEEYAETPQAETARERLAAIEDYPALPEQQLAWLTTIFADRNRAEPLEQKQPNAESSDTILR